jgi:small subunit ribosomal protein S18
LLKKILLKKKLKRAKKKETIMSKYDLPKKFDHKDIDILKPFITETGKIIPARVTGVSASNQRKITKSIKIARFLALLPYTDMHQ